MEAPMISLAQNCLNAAYDKTMAFPDIVGTLMEAGFEGYAVDYRRNTTTYYLANGDNVVIDNRPSDALVEAKFDLAGVVGQIKWAQANPADYSYSAFCKNVKGFGCAGYIVSFPGRRVLYFGRTAETHIEYFPQ